MDIPPDPQCGMSRVSGLSAWGAYSSAGDAVAAMVECRWAMDAGVRWMLVYDGRERRVPSGDDKSTIVCTYSTHVGLIARSSLQTTIICMYLY